MNKTNIISKIKDLLANQEDVVFAYLFGSFIAKKNFRDIDIGIYTHGDIGLLRLGELQTELVKAINHKNDLVHLNYLHKQNPALAHEIVSKGLLILNNNSALQKKFKEKVLLAYFDNAALRAQMESAFRKRISEKKIGVRNYAK